MHDPKRLIDTEAGELGLALQEAQRDLPTADETTAMLASMQQRLASEAALGGTASGSAGKAALLWGNKGAGLAMAALAMGGIGLWLQSASPTRTQPLPPPLPMPMEEPELRPEPPPMPVAPPVTEPTRANVVPKTHVEAAAPPAKADQRGLPAKPQAPRAGAQRPAPRATRAGAPQANPTGKANPTRKGSPTGKTRAPTVDPEAEIALIERARTSLGASPRAALASLLEHAARFPDGILAQERELMRIEALSATGQDAAARTRANAFVARFPNSPHRRQLEALTKTNTSAHNPDDRSLPTR